jgi:hypothetical protein
MLEEAFLSRKLSSKFLIFYLENFYLSVRTFVVSFYFFPDPEAVPNPTGSGSIKILSRLYKVVR